MVQLTPLWKAQLQIATRSRDASLVDATDLAGRGVVDTLHPAMVGDLKASENNPAWRIAA